MDSEATTKSQQDEMESQVKRIEQRQMAADPDFRYYSPSKRKTPTSTSTPIQNVKKQKKAPGPAGAAQAQMNNTPKTTPTSNDATIKQTVSSVVNTIEDPSPQFASPGSKRVSRVLPPTSAESQRRLSTAGSMSSSRNSNSHDDDNARPRVPEADTSANVVNPDDTNHSQPQRRSPPVIPAPAPPALMVAIQQPGPNSVPSPEDPEDPAIKATFKARMAEMSEIESLYARLEKLQDEERKLLQCKAFVRIEILDRLRAVFGTLKV